MFLSLPLNLALDFFLASNFLTGGNVHLEMFSEELF